jgi:hypothetical protein
MRGQTWSVRVSVRFNPLVDVADAPNTAAQTQSGVSNRSAQQLATTQAPFIAATENFI